MPSRLLPLTCLVFLTAFLIRPLRAAEDATSSQPLKITVRFKAVDASDAERTLAGTEVQLILIGPSDAEKRVRHTATTDASGVAEYSLELTPEEASRGRWLARARLGETEETWSLPEFPELRRYRLPLPVPPPLGPPRPVIRRGFHRSINAVAYSPDGRRILVGSMSDPAIDVWDLESGELATVTAMGISSPEDRILGIAYVSRPTQGVVGRLFCRDRSVDRSCEDPLCRVDDHGSPNR